jgi:hypothetical protein
VVYTPFAVVGHAIPKERVTLDYLRKRAFIQGISDSYTEIQKNGAVAIRKSSFSASAASLFLRWVGFGKAICSRGFRCAIYTKIASNYCEKGRTYHRSEVSKDKKLLEFILREDYFDKTPSS